MDERRAVFGLTVVLCVAGASAACSSSTTADGGKDASVGAPDATSPADATASDAGAADGGDGGGDSGKTGGVFAISDSLVAPDGGARGSHRAGAFFVRATGEDTTTVARTVGPCVVEKIGGGSTPDETDLSAGAVRITGGRQTIELLPSAKGTYSPVTGGESLWTGGETLTVTADGKDVPAFTTKLVAPSKLTLTAPTLPAAAAALSVARATPFSATWSGEPVGGAGEVVLYFDIATGANAFSATCTFKASAGAGEVPAAAFSDFPAGSGTYNFYVKQTSTVTPADWSVRFTASSAMVGPGGAGAEGSASFK